jgi:hypothetical protein
MSLLGKRRTMLLAVMLTAALACAAVLLAGSAPAFAAKQKCDFDPTTPAPLCLVITDVSPEPGATNVPLADPPLAQAFFNQTINTNNFANVILLRNVDTKEDVSGSITYSFLVNRLTVQPNTLTFECGTTYEVTVGGHGKKAVESESGAKLSGVDDEGVTFKKGVATWTFTTVACP